MTKLGIEITSNRGLHEVVAPDILPRFARRGEIAIDLGSGFGAMAFRMKSLELEVRAADIDAAGHKGEVPFSGVDLNGSQFSLRMGEGLGSLVTAIEGIEHTEEPISFLRSVGRLLKPRAVAVVTNPNVDSFSAQMNLFWTRKIRIMVEAGEPTHISAIFWDLFERQFLPPGELTSADIIWHGRHYRTVGQVPI